jgi:hypothetical protein
MATDQIPKSRTNAEPEVHKFDLFEKVLAKWEEADDDDSPESIKITDEDLDEVSEVKGKKQFDV